MIKQQTDRAVEWIYHGIWGVLVKWFRVPDEPPTLPVRTGGSLQSFHPAYGFLRYLKLWFWLALVIIDVALIVGWLVVCVISFWIGILIAIPVWVIAIVPDVIAFIAIHLRFDSTWYVLSDRSIRIRRGIWVIREITITFENIQNIKVSQGPVQRFFGIKDLIVETAGSGGGGEQAGNKHQFDSNQAVLEGIDNADALRDLIMSKIRNTKSSGLGDEFLSKDDVGYGTAARILTGWKAPHINILREIKDEITALKQ